MREQYIRFTDVNIDGCGTNIANIAKVYGPEITNGVIDRVDKAIQCYKASNEGEWDTEGCLEAANIQMEAEGYKIEWVNDLEICF